MGYFPVRYDSRVVIYECKMFIRLATVFGLSCEVVEASPTNRYSKSMTGSRFECRDGLERTIGR